MADNEAPIIYRFTPQFAGAFLRNVPQRDLTQADVDHMTPDLRRDAFSPHPGYRTPLYTAVEGADVPDFSQVHDAPALVAPDEEPIVVEGVIVTSSDLPKWFQEKQAKAAKDGTLLSMPLPDETQKAYEERIAASFVPMETDGDA